MMDNKFYDELKEKVKSIMGEEGSHDFSHIERVYNNAILISKGLDVDMDVVKVSALLHDISKNDECDGKIKDHTKTGAKEARKILEKMNFPKDKTDKVCKCILYHDKPEDYDDLKELRVLKEADGLEIMGAMGIARTFSYLGERKPWDVLSYESPVNYLKRMARVEYYKLPEAKKIAQSKIKLVNEFCKEFTNEYNK